MAAHFTDWYRIVRRDRKSREDVLKSAFGRFHEDKELEPTTYVADSLMTAWLEVSAHAAAARLNPRNYKGWKVPLRSPNLVDLRNDGERRRQMITERELMADPAPTKCREVARRLRGPDQGKDGLLYPSVRRRGATCAALFLERADARIDIEPVSKDEWEGFMGEVD